MVAKEAHLKRDLDIILNNKIEAYMSMYGKNHHNTVK